jgi:hypothetical protein
MGHPLLYQLNTRVFLTELAFERGAPATLDDIPDTFLRRLSDAGFSWLWLLGVWQTGAAGAAVARRHPKLREEYRRTLLDLQEEDIVSSPFAIVAYRTHSDFGGDAALARFRERARQYGLKLMLDFVPNHTALDHPWAAAHPDYYVGGTEEQFALQPQNYIRLGRYILAHGRDPYFDGWSDTLQLNYGNPACRQAMEEELLSVASRCDGVRCDMSMLLLPEVFERTWGVPMEPFWPSVTQAVRMRHPEFVFLAEVYWNLEYTLQQQGFDFTYDKRLYDRLRDGFAVPVRGHLMADLGYQKHSVRFLENHDEERAASLFSPDMHRAAAILTFLTPGLSLFHQGQLEGRRKRIPMQLRRGPAEPLDASVRDFYSGLLNVLHDPLYAIGDWRLLPCVPSWPGNPTAEDFVAFVWTAGPRRSLVVVNYSPHQSQCFVHWEGLLPAERVSFQDRLSPAVYDRDASDILARGLYLDLPAWGYHVFAVEIL